MSNCQQHYGLDKNNSHPRVGNFKLFSTSYQRVQQQDFHIKPKTSGSINIRVLIAVLSHLYQIHVRQTQVPCILHRHSSCRNGAPCAHRQGICWWTCTMCCIHAVEKFGSQFSKLHSRSEYYITIRNRQFPSQQAPQKSDKFQRMQPCQFSHCATCAFLFENVMSCLIFNYLLMHQCQV